MVSWSVVINQDSSKYLIYLLDLYYVLYQVTKGKYLCSPLSFMCRISYPIFHHHYHTLFGNISAFSNFISTSPVRSVKFLSVPTKSVLSCSDDHSIKLWDVASQGIIGEFVEHSDYVRCIQVSPTNPNLFLSGNISCYNTHSLTTKAHMIILSSYGIKILHALSLLLIMELLSSLVYFYLEED